MFAVALLVAARVLPPSCLGADPIFPPGVRVGITPLVGLYRRRAFVGFETEDHSVKVLVAELPADAYGEVASAFKANPAGAGGIKPESIEDIAGLAYYTAENAKDGANNVRRYSMILPGQHFFRLRRRPSSEMPPKSIPTRPYGKCLPRRRSQGGSGRRQLGLMPFKISELSAFKMFARWRSVLPSFSPTAMKKPLEAAPFNGHGLIGSAPAQPEDRGRFANRPQPRFPGARRADHDVRTIASTASPDTRRVSMRPAARTTPPSPWCNGCDSAARTRCASLEARRATNGRKHFRASAPCATHSAAR